MADAVEMARHYLPPTVRVQMNALDWRDDLKSLVEAGANDLGDLNLEVLSKNDRDPEMELELLLKPLEVEGYTLRPRGALWSATPGPAPAHSRT